MNQVMEAAVAMGLRDLTIAASSTGSAHDPIAQYIKDGIVVGLQTSGIRGKMGEVVSQGYLKTPAIIRSRGFWVMPPPPPIRWATARAGAASPTAAPWATP